MGKKWRAHFEFGSTRKPFLYESGPKSQKHTSNKLKMARTRKRGQQEPAMTNHDFKKVKSKDNRKAGERERTRERDSGRKSKRGNRNRETKKREKARERESESERERVREHIGTKDRGGGRECFSWSCTLSTWTPKCDLAPWLLQVHMPTQLRIACFSLKRASTRKLLHHQSTNQGIMRIKGSYA